ncbi:hypothetical protein [Sphingobacterium sp. BIGb0165]|uniref:hypothetical protein n=1 Tax=Sphingobacterium sp. BIGb0165 TaxID=2940615 RepID=UPI00216A613B|nr:hypothetical protein [Sphingobacterium sp. BIGb0165]MCS4225428.1 hypothetical protein [Sphingobacterium sp. BIGb0165]
MDSWCKNCEKVIRIFHPDQALAVAYWKDEGIGLLRGIMKGANSIAGTAFGENGIAALGSSVSYGLLVKEILDFYNTGRTPMQAAALEILRFMVAAQSSKKSNQYGRLYDI